MRRVVIHKPGGYERLAIDRAMNQVVTWIDDGRLTAPPVTTYALDDVGSAHRDLETGKTVGKLVLIPAGDSGRLLDQGVSSHCSHSPVRASIDV